MLIRAPLVASTRSPLLGFWLIVAGAVLFGIGLARQRDRFDELGGPKLVYLRVAFAAVTLPTGALGSAALGVPVQLGILIAGVIVVVSFRLGFLRP